jgi:uncharacterized lipoprotein YmbA
MTKAILFVLAAMALGGCMITDREATYYTRPEIDALAARMECRTMARTMVQIYRCENR